MNVNNIVKFKDADNKSVIIDLSEIAYFDSTGIAITTTIRDDIELIHNIEKIDQIIKDSNCTSKFLYLHDEENEPILCNIEHISVIEYINGTTQLKFNVNNFTLNVVETVDNIYNKILEYKSPKTNITDNVNTNKVERNSPVKQGSDVMKKIPVLTRVYQNNDSLDNFKTLEDSNNSFNDMLYQLSNDLTELLDKL